MTEDEVRARHNIPQSRQLCPRCFGDIFRVVSVGNGKYEKCCENCDWARPFFYRAARRDKVTPAQLRTIAAIWELYPKPAVFDISFQSGLLYIRLEAGDGEGKRNLWLEEGGSVCIGRRGGAEVYMSYSVDEDKEFWRKRLEDNIRRAR